jgi:hypothetical protein
LIHKGGELTKFIIGMIRRIPLTVMLSALAILSVGLGGKNTGGDEGKWVGKRLGGMEQNVLGDGENG